MAAANDPQARRQQFLNFLEHNFAGRRYADAARELGAASGRWRLLVSLDDVRSYSAGYAAELLRTPSVVLAAMEDALRIFLGERDELRLRVGINGSFGANLVSPRALGAALLGRLVLVEGIVTKVASVKPRLVRSVHYCEETKESLSRTYVRFGALAAGGDDDSAAAVPTHDAAGHPLQFEFGLSQFVDVQKVVVQEMPERAPPGQLPRSVQVTLEHDLVDALKPGDRVRVCGHYRALANVPEGNERTGGSHTSALFRTQLVANSVQSMQRALSAEDGALSADDLRAIKAAAVHSDGEGARVVRRLARSLAPSIFGHEAVKRALLLLLLGGVERVLDNGTHLRGDVNVLLVGDPSTAKSQLLRFVLQVAPLAVSTSGRGSSGVGLTAAVTSDEETGERRLEAGAMVLADRGVVTIDEFDKMSAEDRVAIHEVMEQQTVTIAKAGIHASLNARCAVLAAANPLYGKYDRRRKPADNIALPDSLLSRFDLLFIVLDTLDAEHDRKIAQHVLRLHRHAPSSALGGRFESAGGGASASVYARYGDDEEEQEGAADHEPRYSLQFLKKYILYARNAVQPVLSAEAARAIVDAFEELRSRTGEQRTMPVTPRTLETLIRLSTAHAKARLSHAVALDDTREAVALVTHALYHDQQQLRAAPPVPALAPVVPLPVAAAPPTPSAKAGSPPVAPAHPPAATEASASAAEALRAFMARVAQVFSAAQEGVQLPRDHVFERVNDLARTESAPVLSVAQFGALLQELVDAGRLTYVDDTHVYL